MDGRHGVLFEAMILRLAIQETFTVDGLITDLVVNHSAPEAEVMGLLRSLRADARPLTHLGEYARRLDEHRLPSS